MTDFPVNERMALKHLIAWGEAPYTYREKSMDALIERGLVEEYWLEDGRRAFLPTSAGLHWVPETAHTEVFDYRQKMQAA